MANSIALFKKYVPLLDEVYKLSSLTSDLDGAPELARQGQNVNEMIIPKIDMSGLADYSRNGGYVGGDVTFTNETVKCNFDRGRIFNVDTLDNIETAMMAFGRLASEFIRVKVVPELDAFRFATLASMSGIGTTDAAALSTGANVITALRAAVNAMDEAEVPSTERYLYITPTLLGLIRDLDTTKSKEVLDGFAKIVKVPQSRFYTGIKQLSGKVETISGSGTDDQTAGGFKKADGAKNINFMIIHKPAVIQYQKHVAPKVITPEQNQDADAWKFGYRNVGISDAYENKVAGIYLHKAAS
nr:MAG TPA: Major capsid protein [Caudoviricetes sp.]